MTADREAGSTGESAETQISLFGSPPEDGAASTPAGRAAGAEDGTPAAPTWGAAAKSEPAPHAALEPAGPPGSSRESPVSVSALNAAARRILEESFPSLWVVGEVANWRRVSSGHCYFSLRDEDAQIACVLWRRDARRLPTDPEEGMEVLGFGEVSLYEARGSYQLIVRKLEARGEGLWRLAFERLKRKLAAEGLLEEARKRPLPRVPLRVGVVTSRTGAALRDVITVVRRRAPWTELLVSDCRVQGEEAAGEIVRALDRLVRDGRVEVIVVTRGGGSVEDLWCFNEEAVARAVAACPVPVISAVGHEIDVTITDLVADVRAPTPSAAGELVVPDARVLRADLRKLGDRLVSGLRQRTVRGEERARRAADRLLGGMDRRLERLAGRLEGLGGRLDALSPLGTLRRGYAVPLAGDGRVLRHLEDFRQGDRFRLRVVDGRVACAVEGTEAMTEEETGG
ncbi:MAG: exodeoxyribonuclease VII large subunit [Candidatus Palauibacterales bacterium]|nr:exodeoxyribonuclease VII large subunit [Candidatus Palauibacterales bacterium]MDP2583729.1 exodeoxyribonuclease VII large subunit [Candidatus Palauibacterales bacterium]